MSKALLEGYVQAYKAVYLLAPCLLRQTNGSERLDVRRTTRFAAAAAILHYNNLLPSFTASGSFLRHGFHNPSLPYRAITRNEN